MHICARRMYITVWIIRQQRNRLVWGLFIIGLNHRLLTKQHESFQQQRQHEQSRYIRSRSVERCRHIFWFQYAGEQPRRHIR